jgi:hypothetical protein
LFFISADTWAINFNRKEMIKKGRRKEMIKKGRREEMGPQVGESISETRNNAK